MNHVAEPAGKLILNCSVYPQASGITRNITALSAIKLLTKKVTQQNKEHKGRQKVERNVSLPFSRLRNSDDEHQLSLLRNASESEVNRSKMPQFGVEDNYSYSHRINWTIIKTTFQVKSGIKDLATNVFLLLC